jgi:hypothetical protein
LVLRFLYFCHVRTAERFSEWGELYLPHAPRDTVPFLHCHSGESTHNQHVSVQFLFGSAQWVFSCLCDSFVYRPDDLGYMKFWTTISIWPWKTCSQNFNQINIQCIFVGTKELFDELLSGF